MHQLVLRKKAEKELKRIEERSKPRIIAALFELRKNPKEGKPLKGDFEGFYSLKVYPYRIIYRICKRKVFVVKIGHRQGAYRP